MAERTRYEMVLGYFSEKSAEWQWGGLELFPEGEDLLGATVRTALIAGADQVEVTTRPNADTGRRYMVAKAVHFAAGREAADEMRERVRAALHTAQKVKEANRG